MDLGEFLVENQAIAAPVIEWGGAIFLVALVLSPFLIIRHRIFKPTRWRHIVGAYVVSVIIFVVIFYIFEQVDQWLLQNYLNSLELYGAFSSALLKWGLWLMLVFPLLLFYATKLLYGPFNKKRFLLTVLGSVVFTGVMLIIVAYLMGYFIGQASANF